jgi:hypothetical protein
LPLNSEDAISLLRYNFNSFWTQDEAWNTGPLDGWCSFLSKNEPTEEKKKYAQDGWYISFYVLKIYFFQIKFFWYYFIILIY